MKKRFKPIVQKVLEIILVFNVLFVLSIDDISLNLVPALFIFIIWTGYIAIVLNKYGVYEDESNL